MAAQFPGAVPAFTGSTETAPATTSPTGFADWATKVKDEVVALATLSGGLRHQYGSGLWYAPPFQAGTSSQTLAVGDVRLFRWDFPPGTTVTGLGANIVTGGAAGATKTLLIYNDDGSSSYPGTLQKATSALASTGTNVISETFSAEAVGGVRWIGSLTLTNTTVMTGCANGQFGVGAATILSATSVWAGYIQTGQSSAPGTFTATRTPTNAVDRVFVQIG